LNTPNSLTGPIKATVFGFMGIMAAVVAIAVLGKLGVLGAAAEQRALGLAIGIMVVFMGVYLPRLKPLGAQDGGTAKTLAAERAAGWVLMLAGLLYVGSFLFLPLAQARHLSAMTGIGTISLVALIAAYWLWLARGALLRSRKAAALDGRSRQQMLMVKLLAVFFYVFATACIAFSH
jgi:hypothetical protein